LPIKLSERQNFWTTCQPRSPRRTTQATLWSNSSTPCPHIPVAGTPVARAQCDCEIAGRIPEINPGSPEHCIPGTIWDVTDHGPIELHQRICPPAESLQACGTSISTTGVLILIPGNSLLKAMLGHHATGCLFGHIENQTFRQTGGNCIAMAGLQRRASVASAASHHNQSLRNNL